MAASQFSKHIRASGPFVTVGASKTNQVISQPAGVPVDARCNFRMDVFVGKVVVTTGITVGLQHSCGYNIWSDTKTATVSASTDKSIASQSAGVFTSTSHGLVVGDPVVFGGTSVPAGIDANKVYKVNAVPTSSTFTVVEWATGAIPSVSSAGSSATVTKAQQFSIPFLDTVTDDQAYLPLQNIVRAVCTTGTSDSCQILDVIISPGI